MNKKELELKIEGAIMESNSLIIVLQYKMLNVFLQIIKEEEK